MKRLHILPDEKIINRTIETFEHVFPEENRYIVISSNESRYIQKEQPNVFIVKYGTKEFWKYVGNVQNYQSIIIHLMTKYAVSFINSINHNNIYWIEWGVDLYDILLEPRGFRMYYNNNVMDRFVHSSFKSKIAHKYLNFLFPSRDRKKAIRKVKYFVPDSMYDEYPLLLKYYPQYSHLKYREFFYYPINQVVDQSMVNNLCKGNNIIVGNSASFTGNHLEVIDILSKINLGNRKVKFSLCYGGSSDYRNYISNYGKRLLKSNYSEITEFMPLTEYNKFLLDASYFIYNNYRQEAVGNILVALYFGGKVFLNDNSPLLSFYKRLGLLIFKVSDITIDSLNSTLDIESINRNREIIEKHYSKERLHQLVKQNF